jgi:ADP-heptose:LPS heptosyltransferase
MRVLIIRFSSIGDIVLTTPVVRCVAQQKNAEVFYVTKASFADIPAAHPMVSRVFAFGKPSGKTLFPEKIQYTDTIPELARLLKHLSVDVVIDLHNNLRSHLLRLLLGVRAYGFNKLNFEKWLKVTFGIDRLPQKHIVDRYLEAAAPIGVQSDQKGLDFSIPDHISLNTPKILEVEFGLKPEDPFVALVIGATHFTKRLPTEKLIELCNELRLPVLLIGGPAESNTAAQVVKASVGTVKNACGKWNLFQSAAIVQEAKAVITHDTGMMHIAAALDKPIISIWGSTIPEFGMYPYYAQGKDQNSSVEVKGLPCRPCSKIGHAACPKGHFKCMNLQSVDYIAAQLPN